MWLKRRKERSKSCDPQGAWRCRARRYSSLSGLSNWKQTLHVVNIPKHVELKGLLCCTEYILYIQNTPALRRSMSDHEEQSWMWLCLFPFNAPCTVQGWFTKPWETVYLIYNGFSVAKRGLILMDLVRRHKPICQIWALWLETARQGSRLVNCLTCLTFFYVWFPDLLLRPPAQPGKLGRDTHPSCLVLLLSCSVLNSCCKTWQDESFFTLHQLGGENNYYKHLPEAQGRQCWFTWDSHTDSDSKKFIK